MRRLIVTAGEPAGIGPDIVLRASQKAFPCELAVAADPLLLEQRAKTLNLDVRLHDFNPHKPAAHSPGKLVVLPSELQSPVECGKLDTENARYVLQTINDATDGCLHGIFDGMITAPVQKSVINDAGVAFSGHTEYLADRARVGKVVMMLATTESSGATKPLRVALVTTHIPLSQVPAAVTSENLSDIINILHSDLQSKFKIANPKIAVCGLNPHAGEAGHLGREEIEVIEPVLEIFRANGLQLVGPLPADTAFTPRHLVEFDAFLAMYHDQGLAPLKSLGFGRAVNITLGLPFVRTSVDHGTALNLAGTGKADATSLSNAIDCALEIMG